MEFSMIKLVESRLFLIPFMVRLSQAALHGTVPSAAGETEQSIKGCKAMGKQVTSRSLAPMLKIK